MAVQSDTAAKEQSTAIAAQQVPGDGTTRKEYSDPVSPAATE